MKIFELIDDDDDNDKIILTIRTEAKTIIPQLSQRSHHDQSESLASIIEFLPRGGKPMEIFQLMDHNDEFILTIPCPLRIKLFADTDHGQTSTTETKDN